MEHRGKIGGVDIVPAVNASYEYAREVSAGLSYSGDEPGTLGTGQRAIYSISYDSNWQSGKFLFITPSLDISYKRAFDVQGGVLIEAGHQHGPKNQQGFAFVTVTLDPVKMVNEQSRSSLRLFGSYARRTVATTSGYTLADLDHGPVAAALGGLQVQANGIGSLIGLGSGGFFIPAVLRVPDFGVGQAGLSLSTWNDRLLVQYNFERRNYLTGVAEFVFYYSGNAYTILFPTMDEVLHHADVSVTLIKHGGFEWRSRLNMTMMKSTLNLNVGNAQVTAIGDVAPARWSQTGGWVNRIVVNGFSAGLDVLYHFGETYYRPSYNGSLSVKAVGKRSSVLVPNVYAGYEWKTARSGAVEVFLESRGAIRNSPNDLSDGRRWYTVGGKWSL